MGNLRFLTTAGVVTSHVCWRWLENGEFPLCLRSTGGISKTN